MTAVNIGRLTISEGSSLPRWGYGSEPKDVQTRHVFSDAASAAVELGWSPSLPQEVPQGFALAAVEAHLPQDQQRSSIAILVYRRAETAESFQLEQSVLGQNALSAHDQVEIPSSGLHAVSVRDRPGAAWTFKLPPALLHSPPVELAHVAWEEGDRRFRLTSATLDEEALLLVAESIQQAALSRGG